MMFFHYWNHRVWKNPPIDLKMFGMDQKWYHWPYETISGPYKMVNGPAGWFSQGYNFGRGEGVKETSQLGWPRINFHTPSKCQKIHFSEMLPSKTSLTHLDSPRNTMESIWDTFMDLFWRPQNSKITDRYRLQHLTTKRSKTTETDFLSRHNQ